VVFRSSRQENSKLISYDMIW